MPSSRASGGKMWSSMDKKTPLNTGTYLSKEEWNYLLFLTKAGSHAIFFLPLPVQSYNQAVHVASRHLQHRKPIQSDFVQIPFSLSMTCPLYPLFVAAHAEARGLRAFAVRSRMEEQQVAGRLFQPPLHVQKLSGRKPTALSVICNGAAPATWSLLPCCTHRQSNVESLWLKFKQTAGN